jgi:hypothetical protein
MHMLLSEQLVALQYVVYVSGKEADTTRHDL